MIAHIWEYEVHPQADAEFRRRYGSAGDWVQLFRRATGHLDTLLLRDADVPGRYVTIDRWKSAEAYAVFRERFAGEYAALDRACEALTTAECSLGTFAVEE